MPDRFAVAVSCIDGRTHEALTQWIRARSGVQWVDLVTEPGADGVLSRCALADCDGIRERLGVSLAAHAAELIVIAGHDDCAANPAPAPEHRSQIAAAVEQVHGWDPGVEVVGVWIERDGTVRPLPMNGDAPADDAPERAAHHSP